MKSFNSYVSGTGFVMYSKEVAHLISPKAAIIYGQIVAMSELKIDAGDFVQKDGKPFFLLDNDEIELETGLTARMFRPVIKQLEEMGLLEKIRTGEHAQNHFHVVEDRLYNLLKDYEGTRRQRLKKLQADRRKREQAERAAKRAEAKAKKAAARAKGVEVIERKKQKKQQRQAKPVEAAPVIDDMLPAAGGLMDILRDDQLGAIFEYIEVVYNQKLPVKLTADEIAEICLYIRNQTDYKTFNPLDIDHAFYELAGMDSSKVSKPTHFLGRAIANAPGRRKMVDFAKNSDAAGNKSRGELVEYLRAKDPDHVLVRRYDEEMKAYKI